MRVTIRTTHRHAEVLAQALAPDHTEEMETTVRGNCVETAIELEGLATARSTVDDYLVNLDVAERTVSESEIETMTTTDTTEAHNE